MVVSIIVRKSVAAITENLLDRYDFLRKETKLAKLTRRGFIGQTTASVATISVLAAVPTLVAAPEMTDVVASDTAAAELSATTFSESVVAHVSNLASGEITIMSGTKEIILRDADLVMHLLKAIR
jgi:hypothetical protein